MGQYYTPVVQKVGSKSMKWALCYDYGNGAKLMEHSYIGNNFVDLIADYILDNPCKVWWVGDYSDGEDDNGRVAPKEVFSVQDRRPEKTKIETDNYSGMYRGYLVNKTKKMYVNIASYIERVCTYREDHGYTKDLDGYVVNPLPLLTAIGNGLGGGDYRGINMNLVGDWAGDILYYTKEVHPKLEGYTEFTEVFNEG